MLEPRATRSGTSTSDRTGASRHARSGEARSTAGAAERRRAGKHSESDHEAWAQGLGGIRAVVDAVPEAVLVTAGDGELRFTNRAADRLFAEQPVVDREDLLSRFDPVGADDDGPFVSTDRDDGRESVIVRQRNRPTRWFALRTVRLEDEEPSGDASDLRAGRPRAIDRHGRPSLAFVLRDITDSRDLRPVREAFLGLVSHELRTPITTIYAGSSVLARQPRLSRPETQTLARDVSSEAARLYDLVEDLLVLARIERGVLDPLDEPIAVDRVIASTIRVAVERHGTARIRTGPRLSLSSVRGDATYLEQACRNIVLGLLRRPGQAPQPELEIDVAPDAARAVVRVAVRDEGPPVGGRELDRVFDLPDESTGSHQTLGGLGLFVARQIAEAMGGRTWARNRETAGLELGLELRIDARA